MSAFLGHSSHSAVKSCEIELEDNHLVLKGNKEEANAVQLRGKLRLVLTGSFNVQEIRLRLTGELRKAFWIARATREERIKEESEFLRKEWVFSKKQETLKAGTHEWPFEYILPGSSAESLEGLHDSWIIYRLKATIDRGKLLKDVHARKLVRLVRTFSVDDLELRHNMIVDNTWPDKIKYVITTPSKAVVFGSQIPIDFELTPLLKGLKILRLKAELVQMVELKVFEGNEAKNKTDKMESICEKQAVDIPEGAETEDIEGLEGIRRRMIIKVPAKLSKCTQSMEEMGIQVKHQLRFRILMHNPDGHDSELRAMLPVQIFIAPNLILNDTNDLVNESAADNSHFEEAIGPPPGYGTTEMKMDRLFGEVDTSGYMTPGGASGPETPYALSRRTSFQNDMNSIVDTEVSANTLRNRLNEITNPFSSRFARDHNNHATAAESRHSALEGLGSSYPNSHSNSNPHSQSQSRGSSGTTSPYARSQSHNSLTDYFHGRHHGNASHSGSGGSGARTPVFKGFAGFTHSSPPTPPASSSNGHSNPHSADGSRRQSTLTAQLADEDLSRVPSYHTATMPDTTRRSETDLTTLDGLPSYENATHRK